MERPGVARSMQVGFVVVLVVATAQVVWWIWDQGTSSRRQIERVQQLYADDAAAARACAEQGMPPEELARLYPHLELSSATYEVDPLVLDDLRRERNSKINQYVWEGGFFLLVLFSGMIICWRAIRSEAELRGRQQDFLAAVSHELKSPLAGLQLTAQTMARRPMLEPDRQRWVGRILSDVQRLGTMISNILDTTRLERGEIETTPEPLVLRDAVDKAVQDVQLRAEEASATIDQRIDPRWQVQADPAGLDTVIRNLVENAVHAVAARRGGRIELSAERDGRFVTLVVRDDGIGFEPKESQRLFGRFYRVGPELRRTTPGTGLGLSIVKRYIELDGGRVQAHSDGPGQGATFSVSWPQPTGDHP